MIGDPARKETAMPPVNMNQRLETAAQLIAFAAFIATIVITVSTSLTWFRSMLGWYAFPTDDVSLLPTRVVGSQARRRRQAAAAAKARLVDPDKALKVEDIAPHGYAIERATVRQKETAQPCVSRSPSKHIKRSMTTSAPRTEKPGDFLLAAPRRSPVRVGMEDARAGAKPRLTYRDLRRRSGDLVLERAKPKRPCNDCAMRTSA